MLRNTREGLGHHLRRQDRLQEAVDQVVAEGQNVAGDRHTSVVESQTCRRVPQLLRRRRQYLYCSRAVQETG